jgi:hypothetical protein
VFTRHAAFNEIRQGRPRKVCQRIIESGSLGNLCILNQLGFISGDEVATTYLMIPETKVSLRQPWSDSGSQTDELSLLL